MAAPLTILYTHGLRGDLDALPPLYSFLRQLQAHYREDVVQVCCDDPAPPPGQVLLLDLGDSCAPDVWHCAITGGRSTLVVLDGMGYTAARTDHAAQKQAQLGAGVRLALVDAASPHVSADVLITADAESGALPARPGSLEISLLPGDETRLDGSRLTLSRLNSPQRVGAARLTQIVGRWTLTAHEIHDLPRRTLPDPTIAASVEFVLSEARYAQKRRASGSPAG